MAKSHYCSICSSHYFYDERSTNTVGILDNKIRELVVTYTTCPGCGTLYYKLIGNRGGAYYVLHDSSSDRANDQAPIEVPAAIAADYNEAQAVLDLSPKASAALARRCLQHLLRERGYQQHDLVKQVEAVLAEVDPVKSVPDTLRVALDAVRNFGNFSAHPLTDKTTLQVIDVEAGEAEWCLEILTECFECFYVRPARAAERKAALNQKLANAGKPPAK